MQKTLRSIRRSAHWPLIRVLLATAASYLVVVIIYHKRWPWNFWKVPGFYLGSSFGLLYYQFFEWAYHRWPMHHRFEFKKPKYFGMLLANIRKNHLLHHMWFHGKNFTSREPEYLKHVISPPYLFPIAFVAHWALFAVVFRPAFLVYFLGGIALSYAAFETTHWCTHVPGTFLDRIMKKIPFVGRVWVFTQRYHRLHHEMPNCDFNFTPPFPGDLVGGTFALPPKEFRECE